MAGRAVAIPRTESAEDYIEGQNIAIEWRYADSQAERLPRLAAELVRLNVDVILAAGGEPARAAKQVTTPSSAWSEMAGLDGAEPVPTG